MARRSLVFGVIALGALLSAACPVVAHAETADAPSGPSAAPKKLTITVVASESLVATLRERVGSWFTDGTTVGVVVTSELEQSQILNANAGEVNAWVIPISAERALVSFSTLADAHERHLIREVRLLHGLDELGLERLASVIHSAFVALEEGGESIARADAERALGEAGLSATKSTPPSEFETPHPPAERPPQAAPAPPPPRRVPEKAARSAMPELLFGAAYGVRARGAEGFAHGPEARVGVRARARATAFELSASGQFLWRSHFDAAPFSASVQTTALRLRAGVEPAFGGAWSGAAELGGGFDIASIHADASTNSVEARSAGSQLRPTASAALGVLYSRATLDIAVYGELTLLLDDVRYSVGTAHGEVRLLAPARVEPGLTLACRFRSAL